MGAQLDLQRELVDKITEFAPLDEIRLLLACGAKVNLPVAEGLLPLHYAVYCNNLACVRLLLTRGSWVDSSDDAGYTALHLCSERGFLDTAQLLLRHNARVCFVDRELERRQRFPVLYKSDEPLRLALDNGHLDCARLLLEHGADPNARYFLGGELARLLDEPPPPTGTAVLAALLLEHGADVDAPNRDGLTPLMSVCANRRRLPRHDAPALLAVLLRHGADVNREAVDCRRRRNERRTALHYAVIARSPTLARILIQAGAKVNMSADYDRPTPLDLAVAAGDPSLVELLLSSGAQPNAVHNCVGSALHVVLAPSIGSRPLPSAAEQYRVVELLLEHGADVNLSVPLARGASVKTPLVELLRYYCARLEMEAGGNEQRDTTEQDAIALVRLLLSYGAVVVLKAGQKDPRGQLGNLRSLFVMGQRRLYRMLLEFGENYDRRAVGRLAAELADEELTERTASPSALKHLCRLGVRRTLSRLTPAKVESLQLPASICRYLLCGTQQ